ncbi:MAG: structural protein [Podoviridae sp. ctdb7]|nr:MAG: structural protein [Podoviridae sp. ctdb7]
MATLPSGISPCADAVRAAAGDMESSEIQEIFQLLRNRTKEILAREGALSSEQAALRAAEDLAKQAEHAAIIEKRNALLNVTARARLVAFVRDQFADRPDLGVESFLVGTNLARQGSRLSVAAEQKALGDSYIGGLLSDLERADLVAVLARGDSDQEISDALWRIGKGLDTKDLNPQVVEIAKLIQKYQEGARVDANRAGANIGKMPGYITRQSHDSEKIGSAGFDRWAEDILPRLDPVTFRGEGDPSAFLRGVYDGLVSGDHLKSQTDVKPSGFRGPANLAKKLSQERVLHFRDGVAWHEYNLEYGTGNLREAVLRGLDLSGQNTALMRRLGTNPEANLNMALDVIKEDVRKGGDPEALANFNDARRGPINNRFKEVSGQTRIPGNATQARVAANVRAWQSLSKLGGALLSSFTDLPVAASEMRYQGRSFLGSLAEMAGGLLKGRGSAEQRQILSSFGVYADSMRGEIMRRFSADDSMGGKMSRGMSLFFRLNGLSWWTDANKASAGLMMSHNLAQNKGKAWGSLNADYRRALSLYDLDAGKWDMLREMDMRMADGRDYMTTDGIADISDERIGEYLIGLGRPVSEGAIRETRQGLERSLRAYVNDRVSYAVLEPDARTRSIMNQGTQPGTVPGDLLRFVTQFKSFPAAYMQKTLGRELYGRGYAPTALGNNFRGGRDLINALRNGNGERLALAQLMLWTSAFGYLSMASKDVAKGREPRPADDPKTWMAALVQGGGLGIFGDYLFGEANRFGNTALESAAGPTLGTVADVINLWARAKEGDDTAASALRLAQNNTPFLNLFYTRIALDHLFLFSAQEALSPGSLRRTEERIRKENGQEFLIRPSQSYSDPLGIAR